MELSDPQRCFDRAPFSVVKTSAQGTPEVTWSCPGHLVPVVNRAASTIKDSGGAPVTVRPVKPVRRCDYRYTGPARQEEA